MPFNMPFREFKFSYYQRNPDIVESCVDIYYTDKETNLTWFSPSGPEGRCDGQSVPWLLWPAVGHPLQGTAIRAAFLHDYAYKMGNRPKKQADLMFYHALLEEKDDDPLAKYLGVKLLGFWAWWGRRRQDGKRTTNL